MTAGTVLVVDDDPVIQRLLRLNFEMEGYRVLLAADGAEALDRTRTERPDIVILDVMMPKMNGIQVASTLKADADTADIPIVILSAKAQALDVVAGQATGAEAYVPSPLTRWGWCPRWPTSSTAAEPEHRSEDH